jgi:hypothetical protein
MQSAAKHEAEEIGIAKHEVAKHGTVKYCRAESKSYNKL